MQHTYRTQEEVNAEITLLEELKPRLDHDERRAADVQIQVLRQNLDAEDVIEEFAYENELVLEKALDAAEWLGTDFPYSLEDEWLAEVA